VSFDRPRGRALGQLRSAYPCSGIDLLEARACEQTVFGRCFGNSAEELAEQFGPYEQSTTFGGVFAPDGAAVGAMRLIRPGPERVKTLQDASQPPWNLHIGRVSECAGLDERRTWDVASFGVDSVVSGVDRRIALLLLAAMFGAFGDNEATSFVAVLDSAARRALQARGIRMLNLPDADPAPYLGSPHSAPVYRHLADLHAEHARQFPHDHLPMFHAQGVDGPDIRPHVLCSSVPSAGLPSATESGCRDGH
jgi:hypothetical protein